MYNIQHSIILQNEYPALVTVPTISKIETLKPMRVPYVLINLAKENVFLPRGELLGSLEPLEKNIQKIVTSTSMEMMNICHGVSSDMCTPVWGNLKFWVSAELNSALKQYPGV